VTGAAGFIGLETVKKLLAAGNNVVGIDNFDETLNLSDLRRNRINAINATNFQFLEMNLASSNLFDLIQDFDSIFHFAATPGLLPSWTHFQAYADNNIMASFRLAEAIRATKRTLTVVVASTSSVYGENAIGSEDSPIKPASPYGITKYASEQIFNTILSETLHSLKILRLFSVYGPNQREDMAWQKIIKSIYLGTSFPLTASSNHVRSCTYVGDVAELCLSIASASLKAGTYNICGDEEVNILEGIRIIEEIMGKELIASKASPRRGDQLRTLGDARLAKEHLEFNPKTNFKTGIRNQINSVVV
jgi:UDP-glucuronate 4-epimerase